MSALSPENNKMPIWRSTLQLAAVLAALALRLFFVFRFPVETVDSRLYDQLARNWLEHGVYGLFLDGRLTAVGIRMPGYPAFVAAIYALEGRMAGAVMVVQAALDVATCVLSAALAMRLVSFSRPTQPKQSGVALNQVGLAGLWLAALCPFVANYTAVLLTEVVFTFLNTLALLLLLAAAGAHGSAPFRWMPHWRWFLGGLVTGLATLVRPEAPLLLAAVGLVLVAQWRRPRDWSRLASAGLWMVAGLILPLLPWAARNWRVLGRPQFLAPRYAELPEEYAPSGFNAWTQTWLVRYRDLYWVWKVEEEPVAIEALPASAFDSAEERARVAALVEEHNARLMVSPAMDAEFARIARERAQRHPLRTYVWVPLERAADMWLEPRVEQLPYSGGLWPPDEKWSEDPVDFAVTASLGLINLAYLGLAVAGAWRCRRQPALPLLAAFMLLRTAFLAEASAPEPRYLLVCFPAVWALGAAVWTTLRPLPPGP